jgi:peptide/nickel transport system substrate-binding protein
MKKLFGAAAIVATALVVLSTALASSSAQTITLLRVGFAGSQPSTLDFSRAGGSSISDFVLEQLFQIDPSGTKLDPWLATGYRQTSPTRYVYAIRRGVRFWDGHELTASDVAASLNYWRYPGSIVAYNFTNVNKIYATGRYTVVVTLHHPDASWKWQLAQYGTEIFEDAFRKAHAATFGQPNTGVMGTGPFEIQSWSPVSGAELTANPHWWGGKVPIQHVSVKFFTDEQSMALAFRAGDLDVVPAIYDRRGFAATSGATPITGSSCQQGIWIFPTQTPPWNDVHVRRAVAYALNRRDIITASGQIATPSYTLIPNVALRTIASNAQIARLDASLPLYKLDLAKAKQEMAKSAYPNGFSGDLTSYGGAGSTLDIDQVIINELQPLGINLTLKTIPVGDFVKLYSGPKSQFPVGELFYGCLNPDPNWHMFVLGSKNLAPGSYNLANYAPPVVDTLINEGIATSNPAKRFAVYSKLLLKLQTDLPYVALYVQKGNAAVASGFSWPTFNSNYYNRAWVLEIKKK